MPRIRISISEVDGEIVGRLEKKNADGPFCFEALSVAIETVAQSLGHDPVAVAKDLHLFLKGK